jgi:hypothetical protein
LGGPGGPAARAGRDQPRHRRPRQGRPCSMPRATGTTGMSAFAPRQPTRTPRRPENRPSTRSPRLGQHAMRTPTLESRRLTSSGTRACPARPGRSIRCVPCSGRGVCR